MNSSPASYREYTPETFSNIKEKEYIVCYIDLIDFDEMVHHRQIRNIFDFFEKLAEELYHTRTKNYSWGFKVIEPEIRQSGSNMILQARLFKKENLFDLNSMIFKLFMEYCTIILSMAIIHEIPVKGVISIGELFSGKSMTNHPDLFAREDPLVMADLLKVFSLSEIFPDGFQGAQIPAYEFPVYFGEPLSQARQLCKKIDTVGIFMPAELENDIAAEVSILSDMLVEVRLKNEKFYACNWKLWMDSQEWISTSEIIGEMKKNAGMEGGGIWKSCLDYTSEFLK